MRVAIVTCYKHPDYVRAKTLRAGLNDLSDDVESFVIKNSRRGLLRYLEVIIKVLQVRLTKRPDAYILTFRGYEILPALALISWPKTLIYDEFINPVEWLREPRDQIWVKYVPQGFLIWFYRLLLRRCRVVLTDTRAHADYSQSLTSISKSKYQAVPVSTDEHIFKPINRPKKPASSRFRVFYYGNMLPLHGLAYVLEAAVQLKNEPVEFMVVGGNEKVRTAVKEAQNEGAQIIYKSWVKFRDLPSEIKQANVCLGGPFGGTVQADHVITGKTYQFLACAAPVIVGQNQATEPFSDRLNCLLASQKSPEALVESINWARRHPDKLSKIGQNGRLLYEDKFSEKIVSQTLSAILDRLV